MSGLAQPAAYHILRDGGEYREYGGDYFDRTNPQSTARRLAERLQRIGFEVVLKPSTTALDAPMTTVRKDARGGPCKCAERGLICIHVSLPPVQSQPKPMRTPSQPAPRATAPGSCNKCLLPRNQTLSVFRRKERLRRWRALRALDRPGGLSYWMKRGEVEGG